jgi:uroporphyrinogen-III synthase
VTHPLAGYTIVVTRPAAQAGRFVELVDAAGADCIALPTLVIERLDVEPALADAALESAWDWAIYTSTNAVECAVETFDRLPPARATAAVGRATARALARHGVTVDVRPESANSEGLLAAPEFGAVVGTRVLLVKGEGGRDLLRETLAARGARVQAIDVYRRTPAQPEPAVIARLQRALAASPQRLVVIVTSADVLDALLQMIPPEVAAPLGSVPLLVPGARVAATARERGWHGPVLQAATAEDEAMAAALRSYATGAQPAAC